MIPIAIGFDQREAATYHVLVQSILDTTTVPVSITPLHGPMLGDFDGQQDGTNAFIYSRFLVPLLMGWNGWALYMDSDMLAINDLAELWKRRDDSKAVMVCQHEYEVSERRKFIGTPIEADNASYARKNWSSLILWNCGHPSNRILRREFVAEAGGKYLHRFSWLKDDEIGSVPLSWNHLVNEYPYEEASVAHFTLGAPGFEHYQCVNHADKWFKSLVRANEMIGENPVEMMRRAWR